MKIPKLTNAQKRMLSGGDLPELDETAFAAVRRTLVRRGFMKWIRPEWRGFRYCEVTDAGRAALAASQQGQRTDP